MLEGREALDTDAVREHRCRQGSAGATVGALTSGTPEDALPFEAMESQLVKGRETPVEAFRLAPGVGFGIGDALIGANLDKGSGD